MIVGEHTRDNDLEINILKGKQLTKHPHHLEGRSGAPDPADQDDPWKKALAYIEDDETGRGDPRSRSGCAKKFLDANDRKRARKRPRKRWRNFIS